MSDLGPTAQRACVRCGRPFPVRRYARNQPSACPGCCRSNWDRRSSKALDYTDPVYLRKRAQLLAPKPFCHWCKVRPATTADHLRGAPQGGDHSLENLVPACADCNRLRGASLGGQVTRAKRKRRE
jgi:5-methylcytosine-specific restriction endonuclease McrA